MNKDTLFKSYELKTEQIHMDNWGDKDWHIRELSASAISKLSKSKNEVKSLIIIIIDGVTNENGGQYFNDGDSKRLLSMTIRDLTLIATAITKLSGLGEEE